MPDLKDATDHDLIAELESRGLVASVWNHQDALTAIPEDEREGMDEARAEAVGRAFIALAASGLRDVLGQRGGDFLSDAWPERRDEALGEASAAPRT